MMQHGGKFSCEMCEVEATQVESTAAAGRAVTRNVWPASTMGQAPLRTRESLLECHGYADRNYFVDPKDNKGVKGT